MDRVTAAFLADFAKEHELTHLPQEKQFEHFAAFVTVRRHYNGEWASPLGVEGVDQNITPPHAW